MPIRPGDVGVTEAGDDAPNTIGEGANPAEACADFFVRGVVRASHGEAPVVFGLMEFVEDAAHRAVGGCREVDAVGGQESERATHGA